jgi:uncharacterized protein (TIGR02996 family)
MTEDEAFIRAILAHPGAETPRLVYADWLDAHSDPRAAYLRAEAEAVLAGGGAKLRELAAGLDPVWVARVSRPPFGVCCDHFVWAKRGAHATDAEVRRFEQEIGKSLPSAFWAFILNNNGAEYGTSDDHDSGWRLMPLDAIRDTHATGLFNGPDASPEAAHWLRRLLWIGQGFEVIDQLMLGLSGRECGMICVIDSQVPLNINYEWFLPGFKPHSTTLAELLSALPNGPQ